MKKIVIVTGANGDIGLSIVKRLTSEKYHVIAVCKDDARRSDLQAILQTDVDIYTVDFTVPEQIREFCTDISQKYDQIYGIINNAGMYPIERIDTYTEKLWEEVLMVNLTAPFLLLKYLVPHIVDEGRIINISSTGAHLGSRDPGYCASKAGLIGLTKSLARTLGERQITVNAVAPGTIDTQMSRRMKLEDRQKNAENSLVKRLGKPEDVSSITAFLLSDDASYITGFTVDVNGGLYIR